MKKGREGNLRSMNRREFLAGAAALGAAGIFGRYVPAYGAMAPVPEGVSVEVPVLNATPDGNFKILVITDLHYYLNHLVDQETTRDLKKLSGYFEPDLVVSTGDNWHNNPEGNGLKFCKFACGEIAKMQRPWAFVWGNHDIVDDYNRAHKLIRSAPNSLYRGDAADGNYRIEVRDAAGETVLWNLIMLNDSRGGMRQAQVDWFNAEAEIIRAATPQPPPAFLFFHIPLQQYDDLAKSGKALGVKHENVCHEDGTRDAIPAFRDAGFVRGMFCGHDHVNDYYGMVEGLHLEYARATGLGGYGGDRCPKGGTLIEMNCATGTFKSTTVFPDGSTWTPDSFVQA